MKGGLSGLASGALLQPLNVIKTSMQISPLEKIKTVEKKHVKSLSFMQASNTIYHQEGLKGFLRGLSPSLIKNFLTSGTYFSSLYFFEEKIKNLDIMSDAKVHFTASCCARTVQSIISNPIIIIKTRLEVIGFNEYNSISDACRKIYLNEGLGGFMTGVKISLIRDVPFSGIFYPIYNLFKYELAALYELKYKSE